MGTWFIIGLIFIMNGINGYQFVNYGMMEMENEIVEMERVDERLGVDLEKNMISLDEREWVSGLIGQWPDYVVNNDQIMYENDIFAVRLDYVLQEGDLISYGYRESFDKIGYGQKSNRLFIGFQALNCGCYDFKVIILNNGEKKYEKTYTIEVYEHLSIPVKNRIMKK
ncbi:MAG: hypothetical protein JXR88_16210 [Clostridia bacterium]|nr:hypothetical protein [Clostridia bacterium]